MLIGTMMIHLGSDKLVCGVSTLLEFEKKDAEGFGVSAMWCLSYFRAWAPIHMVVLHWEMRTSHERNSGFGNDPVGSWYMNDRFHLLMAEDPRACPTNWVDPKSMAMLIYFNEYGAMMAHGIWCFLKTKITRAQSLSPLSFQLFPNG